MTRRPATAPFCDDVLAAEDSGVLQVADTSDLTLLTLPPVPLATGQLVFARGEDRPRRLTGVDLVLTTEDGEEVRVPLVHQHGAWWPPTARLARA